MTKHPTGTSTSTVAKSMRYGRPGNIAASARARSARRRKILFIALTLTLCVECAVAAVTSPWLYVRKVTISGSGAIPRGELDSALRSAHVQPGLSILSGEIGGIVSRLQEEPFVSSIKVVRSLPSTIKLELIPRVPFAATLIQGRHWETDREGVIIRRARSLGTPIIELMSSVEVRPGIRVTDEAFVRSLDILAGFQKPNDPSLDKIVVDRRGHLCLNMTDGLVIRLGFGDSLHQKHELVRKIYSQRPNVAAEIEAIDLTAPDQPVCIPRSKPDRRSGT